MSKHIERQLVRTLIREKRFLRSLTMMNIDGETIPGEAFGCVGRLTRSVAGDIAVDYVYSIHIEDGNLNLIVDAYTASGNAERAGDDWSVDEWTDQMISLTARSVNRKNYQLLVHVARSLLAGMDVQISGTDIFIKGIPNAKRSDSCQVRSIAEILAARSKPCTAI